MDIKNIETKFGHEKFTVLDVIISIVLDMINP